MTHMCVGKLSIIGSDNCLSPDRRQAILWTNAGISLIGTLGTNVNNIFIEIHTFSFKNIHLKMSSGKCRPFCLGLNELSNYILTRSPGHIRDWRIFPLTIYHGLMSTSKEGSQRCLDKLLGYLFVCFITKSFLIHFFHLYLLYQPHLGLCQAQCVQSH